MRKCWEAMMNQIIATILSIVSAIIVDILNKENIITWKIVKTISNQTISINIIEIFIIIAVIYLFHLVMPKKINHILLIRKTKILLRNWITFRKILNEYQQTHNTGIQNKFDKVRIKFRKDFHYFSSYMQDMLFLTYSVRSPNATEGIDNIDETYAHTKIIRDVDYYSSFSQINQCLTTLIQAGRPPVDLYVYDKIFEGLIGYYESKKDTIETSPKTI
jgi:hypothetical protein